MDFEEFLKRIKPKLKAITKKLNGRYTAFNDEDLYQEALLHLWGKYKNRELESKTDSFILQSCYFFLKNYIRKVHKKIYQNCISLNSAFNNEGDSFEDILPAINKEQIIGHILAGLLMEDIQRLLTKRERDIFSLSWQGFSIREAGQRLGISHTMVVKIEKRIRHKCREFKKEIISY